MAQVYQTSRQDLPDWARAYGQMQENLLLQYLFPEGQVTGKDKNGNPTGYDPGNVMPTADRLGMPSLPYTSFNPLQIYGQYGAVQQATANQGINNQVMQWITDSLSRGAPGVADTPTDFARMDQTFNLAGPLAGATRSDMLDALTGQQAQSSYQKYLDEMYGKTANAADLSAYNTLANQGMANDASLFSYAGQNAGAANQTALDTILGRGIGANYVAGEGGAANQGIMDTISGRYMSPNSNPWLSSTVDSAEKALADNYRYATAPSTDAQFARAGSFGGSAHQQTKDMQQFALGRNMSDLANQMYATNYANERQNQLGAINQVSQMSNQQYAQALQNQQAAIQAQQGISQNALQNALARAQQTQESSLQRGAGLAQDAQAGYRQLLDNMYTRQQQGSEAELNRGLQLQSILPQLMQSQYLPYDVMRTIGGEDQALADKNAQIKYQNQNALFQLPFNLLNILGANLGSATGGQGVTTQTSTNPNTVSPGAQILGGLGIGTVALSNLGNLISGNPTPAPAANPTA